MWMFIKMAIEIVTNRLKEGLEGLSLFLRLP